MLALGSWQNIKLNDENRTMTGKIVKEYGIFVNKLEDITVELINYEEIKTYRKKSRKP